MGNQLFRATRIGCFASQCLEAISVGKVMGSTSKGIFLLFGRYSLFVTTAQGLSPFNVVLPPDSSLPSILESNDEVFYSLNELLVPTRQVNFLLQDADLWTPPLPLPALVTGEQQKALINRLVANILSSNIEKGFLYLTKEEAGLTPEQSEVKKLTRAFTTAFQQHDLEACQKAATRLFGRGGGLTPSGDDWITGFILYQVRVNAQKESERAFIYSTGRALTDLAYSKTTFISANRLEAACQGWSDELLLRVVDYAGGKLGEEITIMAGTLFEFGHSSGVDTLLGMAAAVGIE